MNDNIDNRYVNPASGMAGQAPNVADMGEPALEIAERLVADALAHSATYLYLDPTRRGLTVKRRTANGLEVVDDTIEGGEAEAVVAAMKSLVGLDPALTGAAQSGSSSIEVPGGRITVQSTCFPAVLGESVTVSLTRAMLSLPPLDDIVDQAMAAELRVALERPFGVLLTTGPTGSGKSTICLSLLAEASGPDVRVMTIEDPIAFELEGAVQALVAPGFGVAEALRAMGEADCDVAYAAELTTPEEFDMAFRLARGGRRCLSVTHAPDTVGALHRLIHHFGVDPGLLVEGLSAIVGQRLVRRSCKGCRTERPATPDEAEQLGLSTEHRSRGVVVNAGCATCEGTGMGGRVAAVELLLPTPALMAAVVAGADVAGLRAALGSGFRSIDDRIRDMAVEGEVAIDVAIAAVAAHVQLTSAVGALLRLVESEPDRLADIGTGTVTIMFSDIVDSTVHNSAMGDQGWMEVLRHHNVLVRKQLDAWGGREVKTNGDSFMVAFPSATAGVRCAVAIQDDVAGVQLPDGSALRVRIGLHAGEPVREGNDFFGVSVVVAARIGSLATGGEVLVSDLVRSLVEPAGFSFGEARAVELKGLAGSHLVYPVIN